MTPVSRLAVLDGAGNRGCAAVGRQDRAMKIDAPQPGDRQERWRKDLAVRRRDQQIGVQAPDQFQAFG